MPELSHVDDEGTVRMVDVGAKPQTARSATAQATVRFHERKAAQTVKAGDTPKGDVLGVARIAGIQAAKRTAELIPLCHPLPLDHVDVELVIDDAVPGVRITATARCRGSTGVEMEALTAVSIAALTIIDMLKAVDRWMSVEGVQLVTKTGGRHGTLTRPQPGG
jgi:cyclic pyranopterin phosphate synthase